MTTIKNYVKILDNVKEDKTKQKLFLRITGEEPKINRQRGEKKRLPMGKIYVFNLNENSWIQTHTMEDERSQQEQEDNRG